jgi:hypothetical protein
MSKFEHFLLALVKGVVAAAPLAAPIFIHSPQGVMIFNASEALSAGILQQFAAPPVVALPAV